MSIVAQMLLIVLAQCCKLEGKVNLPKSIIIPQDWDGFISEPNLLLRSSKCLFYESGSLQCSIGVFSRALEYEFSSQDSYTLHTCETRLL